MNGFPFLRIQFFFCSFVLSFSLSPSASSFSLSAELTFYFHKIKTNERERKKNYSRNNSNNNITSTNIIGSVQCAFKFRFYVFDIRFGQHMVHETVKSHQSEFSVSNMKQREQNNNNKIQNKKERTK